MVYSFSLASHSLNSATTGGHDSVPISWSPDGRFLLFSSQSNTIATVDGKHDNIDYYVYDSTNGNVELVTRTAASATTAANGDVQTVYQKTSVPGFMPNGHILFTDTATDMTAETDSNGHSDLFAFNPYDGSISLVSHTYSSPTATSVGSMGLYSQSISTDGRYYLLEAGDTATDLTAVDNNGLKDLYLYDMQTGTRDLVTHAAGNNTTTVTSLNFLGYVFAPDGGHAAYDLQYSQQNVGFISTAYIYDAATHAQVSLSNATYNVTTSRGFSPDGGYLVYEAVTKTSMGVSEAVIRLHNVGTNSDVIVSHVYGAAGTPTADHVNLGYGSDTWFSPDSHSLLISSAASNLAQTDSNGSSDLFLYDVPTGNIDLITHAYGAANNNVAAHTASSMSIEGYSANSRYLLYSSFSDNIANSDTNNGYDFFLYDRTTHNNLIVGQASSGTATTGNKGGDTTTHFNWMSPDSKYLLFSSSSSNIAASDTSNTTDTFLLNMQTGTTTLVSHALGSANTTTAIGAPLGVAHNLQDTFITPFSPDSRYILLVTNNATPFTGNDNSNGGNGDDLFLYDTQTGSLKLITHALGAATTTANGSNLDGVFTADSKYVVFSSYASNLTTDISPSNTSNIFIYDIAADAVSLVSQTATGHSGNNSTLSPIVSPDGAHIAVRSFASDLNSNRASGSGTDLYVTDLPSAPPNAAPTAVTLTNKVSTLAENTSTASHIKVADITITDDGHGTNTLAVTGADAARFEIVGSALYLKANTTLDYEIKSSYAVTVTVNDASVGATPDVSTNYALTISNANDAPAIASNGGGSAVSISLAENAKAVTTIHATDQDGNTLTYALAGGDDAAKFVVNAHTGALAFKSAPDFENPSDKNKDNGYLVKVQVSDGHGGADTQTLTVKVTDVKGVTIKGTGQDDKIDAKHAHDGKVPGTENDTLLGKGGDDTLRGLGGDDTIKGSKGADTFYGGKDADHLYAGKDGDRDDFVFAKGDSGKTADAADRIFQFDGGTDKIDLSHLHVKWSDITLGDSGKNVEVSVDYKGSHKADMLIEVMKVDELHQGDFLL